MRGNPSCWKEQWTMKSHLKALDFFFKSLHFLIVLAASYAFEVVSSHFQILNYRVGILGDRRVPIPVRNKAWMSGVYFRNQRLVNIIEICSWLLQLLSEKAWTRNSIFIFIHIELFLKWVCDLLCRKSITFIILNHLFFTKQKCKVIIQLYFISINLGDLNFYDTKPYCFSGLSIQPLSNIS